MSYKAMPLKDRFMKHVFPEPNSGCWLWVGFVGGNGYGGIRQTGPDEKSRTAHRVSWEIHFGPIPPGLCVLHKCDVRSCVNPQHLFLGTKKDNTQDSLAKGRFTTGEVNGWSKLTDESVMSMRRRRKLGEKIRDLASEFGVCYETARRVLAGERWKHLPFGVA